MSLARGGLRWVSQVATEVALAPRTVADLRRSLGVLAELGSQVDTLAELPGEIDALTSTLQSNLPALLGNVRHLDEAMGELGTDLQGFRLALEQTLPELAELVGGMDDRLQRMEDVVSNLGESILALMGAIPGVRRALRDGRQGALPG